MHEIDDELERRLSALERGDHPGMVQDDLPLKDLVVLCVALVLLSAALLVWVW